MYNFMIDLETIEDPHNPPKPPKEGKEPSFPSAFHWKIVAFGLAALDDHETLSIHALTGTEREKLVHFTDALGRKDRVLTFNGRGFDLPVIDARCFHHGLSWPWYHGRVSGVDPKRRYDTSSHCDLMDYLGAFGAGRSPSMHAVARAMGLAGKGDVTGADVAGLFLALDEKAIEQYVLSDVAIQTAIFLRTELLRGVLDLKQYRAAMTSWMRVVDGVVPSVLVGVNEAVLMVQG